MAQRWVPLLQAFVALLATASLAAAQNQVTYNVVALTKAGESVAVVVDGKNYPLQPSPDTAILHTGSAPAPQQNYHYALCSGQTCTTRETPDRSPSIQNGATPNEFFNRTWTTKSLKTLSTLLEPVPEVQRVGSDLHPADQIPTVHIVADQSQVDNMQANYDKQVEVPATMTYIRADGIQHFANVTFELSGHGSRKYPKQNYNIKLNKKDKLAGYKNLKLRAVGSPDPSYIREDLVYKAMQAIGVPTSHSSFVRFFVNDQAIGLFGFVEAIKPNWVDNNFGNGSKDYKPGYLYYGAEHSTPQSRKKNHTADLAYYGDNVAEYQDGQYTIKAGPDKTNFEPLMRFTKFVNDAPTNDQGIDTWKQHLDVESFLRSMAIEFVYGLADGYSAYAHNYALYEYQQDKFVYFGYDHTNSLGYVAMKTLENTLESDYHKYPYLAQQPLTAKVLQVPALQKRFEELIGAFNQLLLSADVLDPVLDSYLAFLEEDVAWDKTLPRLGPKNPKLSVSNDPKIGDVYDDAWAVAHDDIPLHTALKGTIDRLSLMSVSQWAQKKYQGVSKKYPYDKSAVTPAARITSDIQRKDGEVSHGNSASINSATSSYALQGLSALIVAFYTLVY